MNSLKNKQTKKNYMLLTLQDEIFQSLIDEKVKIQIKQMKDQKWYPEEIKEIEERIKARGALIRGNTK